MEKLRQPRVWLHLPIITCLAHSAPEKLPTQVRPIPTIKKSWVHSSIGTNLQGLETQALGNHDFTLVRIQTSQHRNNQEA